MLMEYLYFLPVYDKIIGMKTVVVGMSGGVDSSVAALLLKEQGYNVIGLFMHNWQEERGGTCTAEDDYADVRRVCSLIGIPYYTVDFSKEYWDKVFLHFVDEYKKGRTPNPDVLCNREIKFGVFLEHALKLGADYLATGHYCGIKKVGDKTYLTKALDQNKDQTYFLNQVTEKQLEKVIFPLSGLSKEQVRGIAENANLITAKKKDSTGVCFIGERDFRKFLTEYIPMKQGDICTLDGKKVGSHNGVFYYTIGQHKGFGLGGLAGEQNALPWYIIKKDVEKNILYVNQGETPQLFSDKLTTEKFNFITDRLPSGSEVDVRIRHRQPLQKAKIFFDDKDNATVIFEKEQRAIVGGQYCVVYVGDICIGGAVID